MRHITTHRTTITLVDDSFAFLNRVVGDNRNVYIIQLSKQACKIPGEKLLFKANQEEAQDADSDYQEELKKWESALSVGL